MFRGRPPSSILVDVSTPLRRMWLCPGILHNFLESNYFHGTVHTQIHKHTEKLRMRQKAELPLVAVTIEELMATIFRKSKLI